MKIIKADSWFIGLLLVLAGIFILFLPGMFSFLFYIAGIAAIVYGIAAILGGKGQSASMAKGILAILAGVALFILPKLLSVGVPMIIGVILTVTGISRAFTAAEHKDNPRVRNSAIITALWTIPLGIFFIIKPGFLSHTIMTIVGAVLLIAGIGVLIFAYFTGSRNTSAKGRDDSIIDIDNFTVHDDKWNRLK